MPEATAEGTTAFSKYMLLTELLSASHKERKYFM